MDLPTIRATSNETLWLTTGDGLKPILHAAYPLLTDTELGELMQTYTSAQFSSHEERDRAGTGEASLRCGVRIRLSHVIHYWVVFIMHQRELLGGAGIEYSKAWTYRYNQPNPTHNRPGVTEHAAENWMMFLGTNTGCATV